jgi:hypothetical protein
MELPGRYEYLYDDLVPLVMPPTSVKILFYRNLSLCAQRRRAAERLAEADRLVVIGYSFPKSDLQMRQFVAKSVGVVPVVVVDLTSEPAQEIAKLLPGQDVYSFDGVDAVQRFVEACCPSVVRLSVVVNQDGALIAELHLNGNLKWASAPFQPDAITDASEAAMDQARAPVAGST